MKVLPPGDKRFHKHHVGAQHRKDMITSTEKAHDGTYITMGPAFRQRVGPGTNAVTHASRQMKAERVN